jgi:hypothetical protein
MIAQKIKIHYLFWLVSLIILLIGLYDMDGTLDINVHDTYFVIPHFDIAIILSIIYFIYGFGYWMVQEKFKKRLVKILTLIHSVILIGSFRSGITARLRPKLSPFFRLAQLSHIQNQLSIKPIAQIR